jgi:asparagine synthase (glutamine-hydrolysing)
MQSMSISHATTIKLFHNLGYEWTTVAAENMQISVKGFAFKENTLFAGEKLAWLFFQAFLEVQEVEHTKLLQQFLQELNGTFAGIVRCQGWLFATVDRVRSIPLFYGQDSDNFYLSDNAYWIQEEVGDTKPDLLGIKEFMLTGYVTGPDTLFPKVKQLQAGECIYFRSFVDRPELKTYRYYQWIHENYFDASEEELHAEMDRMHLRVFERLLETTKGRTVVVPLSGGYDSRLIVTMLKRLGRDDVICFSYGRPGNWESEISRRVADRFGYRWLFVPYDRKNWYKWFHSQERRSYSKYGTNLSSLAIIQDFAAVWSLTESATLPKDAIFIPGHTGDFISGGHIPKRWDNKRATATHESLALAIFRKHYSFWPVESEQLKQTFSSKLRTILANHPYDSVDRIASAFEKWEWQERQTKFIVNSVRVYEYWEYMWTLPLWDNEMLEFWRSVPLQYRINKRLYDSYVHGLFCKNGVDYEPATIIGRKTHGIGLASKVLRTFDYFLDPRLGRYSISEFMQARKLYVDNFPTDFRSSIRRIINVQPMGVYTTLREIV